MCHLAVLPDSQAVKHHSAIADSQLTFIEILCDITHNQISVNIRIIALLRNRVLLVGNNIQRFEIVVAICCVNLTEFLTHSITNSLAVTRNHQITVTGCIVK